MNERNHENFIMLPTVDFCFKELMKNPKVRKGFIRRKIKMKTESSAGCDSSEGRIGRKRGEEEGRRAALRELVGRKLERGMSAEQIAEWLEMDAGYGAELAEEYRSGRTE